MNCKLRVYTHTFIHLHCAHIGRLLFLLFSSSFISHQLLIYALLSLFSVRDSLWGQKHYDLAVYLVRLSR